MLSNNNPLDAPGMGLTSLRLVIQGHRPIVKLLIPPSTKADMRKIRMGDRRTRRTMDALPDVNTRGMTLGSKISNRIPSGGILDSSISMEPPTALTLRKGGSFGKGSQPPFRPVKRSSFESKNSLLKSTALVKQQSSNRSKSKSPSRTGSFGSSDSREDLPDDATILDKTIPFKPTMTKRELMKAYAKNLPVPHSPIRRPSNGLDSESGVDGAKSSSLLPSIKRSKSRAKMEEEEFIPVPRAPLDLKKYRYKFYPGNNGRVVLQAFRKRTWMYPVQNKKLQATANAGDIGNQKEKEKEEEVPENATVDFEILWEMYRSAKRYKTNQYKEVILNHIQGNSCLVQKKGLFFSMRAYSLKNNLNLHEIVPRTFYVHANGKNEDDEGDGIVDDTEGFIKYNEEVARTASSSADTDGSEETKKKEEGIIWICKPAACANRGYGIAVVRGVDEVLNLTRRAVTAPEVNPLDQCKEDGEKPDLQVLTKAANRRGMQEGWIVQEYIEWPLLVRGRKFDIRVFVLLHLDKSKNGGKMKAYFYDEAYVRTSWKKYSLKDISDRECHLTNDAVQQKAKGYGKFEAGNKLTLDQWQETINQDYPGSPPNVVHGSVWPEIKRLTALSISAGLAKLEKSKVTKSFELLGYDYMITNDFKPLLIETSIDVLCPPPAEGRRTKSCEEVCQQIAGAPNKFEELTLMR